MFTRVTKRANPFTICTWTDRPSELQKHFYVVMMTQSEHKLQTLIDVCNDVCSMRSLVSLHRPAGAMDRYFFAIDNTGSSSIQLIHA